LARTYPQLPPFIHCETPVFHPNVSVSGAIGWPLVRMWTAGSRLRDAFSLLLQLLRAPLPDFPMNAEATSLLNEPEQFLARARQFYTQDVLASMSGLSLGASE